MGTKIKFNQDTDILRASVYIGRMLAERGHNPYCTIGEACLGVPGYVDTRSELRICNLPFVSKFAVEE